MVVTSADQCGTLVQCCSHWGKRQTIIEAIYNPPSLFSRLNGLLRIFSPFNPFRLHSSHPLFKQVQSVSTDLVESANWGESGCYQQLSGGLLQIMWIWRGGNSSNNPSLKEGHTKGRWKLRPSLPYYCPPPPSSISPFLMRKRLWKLPCSI